VAVVATKVHVVFQPIKNPTFVVVFHVAGAVVDPADARIAAILAAINSVTRAAAIEISLSLVHQNSGSVTPSAPYVSQDKALFVGQDVDGQAHNFKVPGLLSTILSANKEDIDITIVPASTYVTAVIANALGPGGVAVSSVTRANRIENRKRLKK
jgi:hypothetical protein